MSNCFRIRAVMWHEVSHDLTQFSGTGDLMGVLAQLISYTNRFRHVPQVIVIENELNQEVCVDNSVFEELSVSYNDPNVDLEQLEKKTRKEAEEFFREYRPPEVELKLDKYGRLKEIIIRRPDE